MEINAEVLMAVAEWAQKRGYDSADFGSVSLAALGQLASGAAMMSAILADDKLQAKYGYREGRAEVKG